MSGEFERDVYYLILLPNLLLIHFLIYLFRCMPKLGSKREFERDVYYLILLPNLLLIHYLIYYSAPARAWMGGEYGRD